MRERQQTSRRTARFRYWSRKAYAAFASIGVCVTIGRLRKNVTETALKKQQTLVNAVEAKAFASETTPKEKELSPTISGGQQLPTLLLPQQQTEVASAAKGFPFAAYHLLYNERLSYPDVERQPLFFYSPQLTPQPQSYECRRD